jgi:hypothetical protein
MIRSRQEPGLAQEQRLQQLHACAWGRSATFPLEQTQREPASQLLESLGILRVPQGAHHTPVQHLFCSFAVHLRCECPGLLPKTVIPEVIKYPFDRALPKPDTDIAAGIDTRGVKLQTVPQSLRRAFEELR